MKKTNCTGLNGRDELIKRLIQSYQGRFAEKFVLLTGLSGSGKSYVINSVVKGLEKRLLSPLNVYISRGDVFVPASGRSLTPRINELNFSIGIPTVSIGCGVGLQDNDSRYQYVRRFLRKGLHTNILLCIDDFSDADSTIKSFIQIIAQNLTALEEDLDKKLFFLLTDSNADSFYHIFNLSSSIEHITMQTYVEKDIIEYLKRNHLSISVTDDFQKKIKQIQQICQGNLALVDFLFVDIQIQGGKYFEALEKVVFKRLSQLKLNGQKNNISETDMEDIILSSALSLQKFTPISISKITNRDNNVVANSLDIAKNDAFVDKDEDCFYDFNCAEIQSFLRKQGINERKERLLYYYRYYTETEQDEYYFRGYYLAVYYEMLTPQAFALLSLAYVSAQRLSDYDLFKRIEHLMEEFSDQKQRNEFMDIQKFYDLISNPDSVVDDVYCSFKKLKLLNLELPLMGELTRACFHFIYVSCASDHRYLKTLMDECLQYAQNELTLSNFSNPIGLKPSDETIIRLAIIYEIAPCLLDVMNDYNRFYELYSLSEKFSLRVCTREKGLAQYIQNVFNRKAFLFANQTQCEIYYERAKKYFFENQIWDEYCITLVCQAGTNIVIQKYKEAQKYCDLAIQIAEREGIELPLPAKIKNNLLISKFLEYEQTEKNQKKCAANAKKTIVLLAKELQGVPRATEFVILTNLCSLCLYCNDHAKYLKYKHKVEKLMVCKDVSDVNDQNTDDFYRYYFAWFEIYRAMCDGSWEKAEDLAGKIDGFVPALFRKQEIFWGKKNAALQALIAAKKIPTAYDFCNNLVQTDRRETLLAKFFFRGLMLSDLQYTSYQ